MELNEDQLDRLRILQKNSDFALYLVLLQDNFNNEYKKLRKCLRDNGFYKIQGRLDGIEYAKTLVDRLVQEHSHNPKGREEGE